ncbi:aldose epimerase family protein [Herbiconiux sp. KACC 21604]|uniref:aldose epimerase family protein n=1 Tax=unclassified Herbiconiux TaxID=2618217 RepID=UPI001490C53D|nr:aldose epimerase family protein [Herbiconiux sp. SALV-R1]QJU55289.1 galactose mutarotase [Herbiconiux sp. SALV-R1]WPO86456.1 aldose epimerase family protein [Herbiconiux sp. KACC 21604]
MTTETTSPTATSTPRAPHLFTLENDSIRVVLTDAGARLLELWVPDAAGERADVVLGRDTLANAFRDPNYMGSTAGRYTNRIRDGRFTLDATTYQLELNEGRNHLHGGFDGFDRRFWDAEPATDGNAVTFRLISADGDGGYPGELRSAVEYRLTGSELSITMTATTDAATIVNLVNHSYFNLGGHASGDVLSHQLELDAPFYTPVDGDLLPTGEILSVEGTPFDFRTPKAIGRDIGEVVNEAAGRDVDEAAGYDHNWILAGRGLRTVGRVTHPASGRTLDLATDQAGVQLYVGGYLGGVSAKAPLTEYAPFAGFTLETQTFPDSPHHSHFPSPVLRAGQQYRNTMVLTFGATTPAAHE